MNKTRSRFPYLKAPADGSVIALTVRVGGEQSVDAGAERLQ